MSTTEVGSGLKLSFDSAGMMMLPEEFDGVTEYDDLYRYELVHGVLVVNPIPSEAEAGPNERLGYLLNDYKENHPQGIALDETLPERYIKTASNTWKSRGMKW